MDSFNPATNISASMARRSASLISGPALNWNAALSPTPGPVMARSSSAAAVGAARFRSRTGNKSIRGHISGPIPIPNPLDEELSMRSRRVSRTMSTRPVHKHSSSAIEVRQLFSSPQLVTVPRSFSRPGPDAAALGGRHVRHQSDAWPAVARPASSAQGFRPEIDITNQRSTFRDSTSSLNSPQRSKSLIRAALGRLFGRRKSIRNSRTTPPSYQTLDDDEPSKQYHTGSTESNNYFTHSQPSTSQKSDSNPVKDYDRALRSHCVSPEDFMTIQSVRNSIHAEFSVSRRRAATNVDAHPAGSRWTKPSTGLTPRPVSTLDWGNPLVDANHDPEEIGRAITTGLKRRSRSMSFIPFADTTVPLPRIRRRSDDTPRYGRESHVSDLGSLGGEDVRNSVAEKREYDSYDAEKPFPSFPKPQSQPERFPFTDSTYMSEMAGMNMKITEAASLETRISGIENRLVRVEDLLTQVCSSASSVGSPANPAEQLSPPMPSSFEITRSSSQSSGQNSQTSQLSFGETHTYVGSIYQQPASRQLIFQPGELPTSNNTIREVSSLPTLSKPPAEPLTVDHYNNLMSLIDSDRRARLALEAQVRELSQQIRFLTKRSTTPVAEQEREAPITPYAVSAAFEFDDFSDYGLKKGSRNRASREDSGIAPGNGNEMYATSLATTHETSNDSSHDVDSADNEYGVLPFSKLSMLNDMPTHTWTHATPQAI